MRLAYAELHGIAVYQSRKEPNAHSLQPTDLLNEACARLLTGKTIYKNRRYFFGAASKAMARILVESARRRSTRKRGGNFRRVDFSEAERIGFQQPSELLDFHAALTRLAVHEPRWSEIAQLRVFGEFSTTEIANILGCGESTARRHWALARRWLATELASPAVKPATVTNPMKEVKVRR